MSKWCVVLPATLNHQTALPHRHGSQPTANRLPLPQRSGGLYLSPGGPITALALQALPMKYICLQPRGDHVEALLWTCILRNGRWPVRHYPPPPLLSLSVLASDWAYSDLPYLFTDSPLRTELTFACLTVHCCINLTFKYMIVLLFCVLSGHMTSLVGRVPILNKFGGLGR